MLTGALLFLRSISPMTWIIAGLVAWGGIYMIKAGRAKAKIENIQLIAERKKVQALESQIKEKDRILESQQGNALEAESKRQAAERAAAAARATSGKLRDHVARLARACNGDPAAVTNGASAPGPGDLLADMQRRLEQAAVELAAVADQRGIAGQQCAADYEAVRGKK